ncbi:hypothetical protein JD844_010327 [Phrynosoma platyrhinos]|uniref:Uncharacterized protein n=1 Tax=Phrynosoma platyrhinos TaxID=52577 RepID=A0ABQ7TI33_PHRPL|nr:hypothetical protein JD844_010327 [Phrynosoma platyrhinos]
MFKVVLATTDEMVNAEMWFWLNSTKEDGIEPHSISPILKDFTPILHARKGRMQQRSAQRHAAKHILLGQEEEYVTGEQ